MDQSAIDHLEKTLDKRLTFEIGPTLGRGFDIWKQDIGSFVGFGFLYMVITSMCNFIPILGPVAGSILVNPSLAVGAAFYAHRIYTNKSTSFNNFFDGFQFWKELAIVGLITLGVVFALLVPLFLFIGFDALMLLSDPLADSSDLDFDFGPFFIGTMVILILGLLYISLCITFAPYLVGFYGLDAISALKYSYRFVSANWIWVFLFFLVAGIISMLGILGLIIGIFITFPMLFAFQFSAFEELTDYTGYEERLNDTDAVNIDDMFR